MTARIACNMTSDRMRSVAGQRQPRLTAVDRVHRALSRRITEGDLRPGTRLRAEAVAQRHGVSRTPVREAFRRLEAEGLVAVLPHIGAQVSPISIAEIDELFEIRGTLEVLAVERAAARADKALAKRLEAQLRVCARVRPDDVERLATENSRLHDLIYASARSPRLARLIDSLGSRLQRVRVASLSSSGRAHTALSEHRAIAAAIVAGDVERARALATEHAHLARMAATRWYLEQQRTGPNDLEGGQL